MPRMGETFDQWKRRVDPILRLDPLSVAEVIMDAALVLSVRMDKSTEEILQELSKAPIPPPEVINLVAQRILELEG